MPVPVPVPVPAAGASKSDVIFMGKSRMMYVQYVTVSDKLGSRVGR